MRKAESEGEQSRDFREWITQMGEEDQQQQRAAAQEQREQRRTRGKSEKKWVWGKSFEGSEKLGKGPANRLQHDA